MELYKGFGCYPAVCCVGENYQIIVPVRFKEALNKCVCGMLRKLCGINEL